MLLKDNIKRPFLLQFNKADDNVKIEESEQEVTKKIVDYLTMKTTVSELKSVSAKTCILLPKVMVSLPF